MKRSSGAKLMFYDVKGDGAKVQVMADLRCRDGNAWASLHIVNWQAPDDMH
jgi:hypothetical protein